jgi:5'-nucleotidase
MRILITNDDGVYSPGIAALAEIAATFGEVRIVAPDVEMSSASHAITATRPLSCKRTPLPGLDAWRVNGTPADCVALGLHGWERVDVVLSGINLGSNLGNAMWHSGTLAGAKQAALLGLRGIALSTPATDEEPDFATLQPWVAKALELLLPATELKLLNVNFPANAPRGILWSRQSVRHYDGKVVPGHDPMGRRHYWMTVVPIEAADEGTDRFAVESGYVSVTPLRLDLTDHAALAEAQRRHPTDTLRLAAAD